MSTPKVSKYIICLSLCLLKLYACQSQTEVSVNPTQKIILGADRTQEYLSILKDKKLALVVNQTSQVSGNHLVDTLISLGVNVECVMVPEHGFRGTASAGEKINDSLDSSTGVKIFSLYGESKKPSESMLRDIDLVVFDIQDVGARFYTYISTLHNVMEACAEQNIPLLVLDRPNPNGFYVDGPVLEPKFESFIGLHPIPVVHGMTIAEFALMINGEGWLKDGIQCDLSFITNSNYTHNSIYHLPVKPSPNLADSSAIYLYPSLCFFEGTVVSVGRGTESAFKIIGYPENLKGDFHFSPTSNEGAKKPRYESEDCRGLNLEAFGNKEFFSVHGLHLDWLIDMYQSSTNKKEFFNRPDFFDLLAGSNKLRLDIINSKTAAEIKLSWKDSIDDFKKTRKKYLLYPDFE